MSRNHFPEQDAIAMQLLGALEQYGDDVTRLVRGWSARGDMEHYARVSKQIDEIRNLCATQTKLSVQWVTMLISYTELMHALWRVSYQNNPVRPEDLQQHLGDHCDCIDALRTKCRRLLAHGAPEGTAQ